MLYIDILGFGELVRRNIRQINRVYGVLDSLNVHQHKVFQTIVFSDTILVYNREPPKTEDDHHYLVWYLIEFAEDLHHRLTGQNIYFRAILLKGEFEHYALENIDCFFGKALVDAYLREKEIPSIGLFIDSASNAHNRYFRTAPFADDLHFVFLNRSIESLHQETEGRIPVDPLLLDNNYPYLPWQVRFLHDIHKMMHTHPNPSVRTKFLTAYDLYRQRYPTIIATLENYSFDLKAFNCSFDWSKQLDSMKKSIHHFDRLGRGSTRSPARSTASGLVPARSSDDDQRKRK